MTLSLEVQSKLCSLAAQAATPAYAPYSKFHVGAAVYTQGGEIFRGCNVENGSYGLTMCAERVAIGRAVSEGEREIVAVAVATASGVSPCGACRQVINEFAQAECPILICDLRGDLLQQFTLGTLLPSSFHGPSHKASAHDNHPG